MTKTYAYDFITYKTVLGALATQEHRIVVKVTDKEEDRPQLKRGYACHKINEILINEYGFKKSVVNGWDLKEVENEKNRK